MRFKGCLSAELFLLSSLESRCAAKAVSVREGAMQLTRTLGASSAASERVSPSTAPFAAAMLAWNGNPVCTATVEKSTIEASGLFRRLGSTFWRSWTAPRKLIWKSFRNSSGVILPKGFKVIVPGK